MVVGVQEEVWEGEKAVPFPSLRIRSSAAPHWSAAFANTPYIKRWQSSQLNCSYYLLCDSTEKLCNNFILDETRWGILDQMRSHFFSPRPPSPPSPSRWYVRAAFATVELPREFSCANLLSRICFTVCFCTLKLTLMDTKHTEKGKLYPGCCPLTFSTNSTYSLFP